MSTGQLTEEQIQELRDGFSLFDKDGNWTINSNELGTVMRSLGQNPTEAELTNMIGEADPDGKGKITFDVFLSLVSKRKEQTISRDEMIQAFQVFDDKNDGTIDAAELRFMLTRLGECLQFDEAQELIKEAGVDENGRIHYADYIKNLNK